MAERPLSTQSRQFARGPFAASLVKVLINSSNGILIALFIPAAVRGDKQSLPQSLSAIKQDVGEQLLVRDSL